MHDIILHAHKGIAYTELILVAVFLILMFAISFGNRKISKTFRKITMFVMIIFHIQFLIGIVMLLTKGLDMSAVMRNDDLRFQYVEHPASMFIAAVMMTIINKKIKVTDKLSVPLVSFSLVVVALFVFALPWSKIF